MRRSQIRKAGAEAIARSPRFGRIEQLAVGGELGAAGQAALRDRFGDRVQF